MPEYDREAGARHVFHLLGFLNQAGWAVSFIAHDATGGERYARILQQMGVTTYAGPRSRWAGDEYLIDPARVISYGAFDLAILWSWRIAELYLPLLRTYAPQARVIVDSGDIHFLREARGLLRKMSPGQPAGILDRGYGHLVRRELNTYAATDAVITVSQKEADLINDFTANPRLAYAMPDFEDIPASPIPYADRRGLVFVGGFLFPPNIDALKYLCYDILPCLDPALLAEDPVYVVGYELHNAMKSLDRCPPNVHMVGWVPSVVPYLQRTLISLVPLRFGAGTKRKLIQSLMAGTPNVSTSVGAEGLGLIDGEHILIADDPKMFAQSIARLKSDPALWQRLATQGQAHVLAEHGRETVQRQLLKIIDEVLSQPHNVAQIPSNRQRIMLQPVRLAQHWRSEGFAGVRQRLWQRIQRMLSLN